MHMEISLAPTSTEERTDDINHGTADFERGITLCGYGRYNYELMLLCGLIFLAVGFQSGVNGYILPFAECDLSMTSEQKGLLNVGFLAGSVSSSLMWGVMADAMGRKKIILTGLLADSFTTLVSSCSQNFTTLFVFRIFNGFVVSGPAITLFSYLGEFHGDKLRSQSICYVAFFWTLSWVILPGLAWIVIPLTFSVRINGFLFNSWRLFLALLSVPSLVAALWLTRYPETPKYLLSQGKSEEALRVLRSIYASNTGRSALEYPVKVLTMDESARRKNGAAGGLPGIAELLRSIWEQICCVFTPPLFKYVVLCCTMICSSSYGYYGLGLWLPELFNRFETYYKVYPNSTVSVCELTTFREDPGPVEQTIFRVGNATELLAKALFPNSTRNLDVDDFVCTGDINEKVFFNTLVMNITSMVGDIVSGFLASRLERRIMPVATTVLAGIAACSIYYLRSATHYLIMTCLFLTLISVGNTVQYSVVVNIFPTHVGAMAVSLCAWTGRLGGIVCNLSFGLLLDISCEVPIFLVGGIVVFGGLLGLLVPTGTIETSKANRKSEREP